MCISAILTTSCPIFVRSALADIFGNGANTFEVEFVTIGDPGNVADTAGDPNPAGSVPYVYRIGKYEISEEMIDKANALGGLGITKDTRGPNKPATRVSWFEAARFVNWLNTSSGNAPAYKFVEGECFEEETGCFQLWTPVDAGYNTANPFRNTLARYFLPTVDEWYKAAFYDPATVTYFNFPTESDTPPIPVASGTAPGTAVFDQPFEQGPADIMLAGGPSPFGTIGQAGNVHEWDETELDLTNDDPIAVRGLRGSSWLPVSGNPLGLSSSFRNWAVPEFSIGTVGFRVVNISVPEPTSLWLIACETWVLLSHRISRRVH
jgi:formylglycine-generating enzyme required for sulfatase activity